MNRKAQSEMTMGIIIVTFIAILVGVIFFQAIAQQAGESTTLRIIANESLGTVSNTTIEYIPYRAITSVVIVNGTTGGSGNDVVEANYTIINNVINPADGSLSVSITPLVTSNFVNEDWFISGTVQPQTYVAESGARSVIGLIAIFFALAVMVVALEPTLRSRVLETFGS